MGTNEIFTFGEENTVYLPSGSEFLIRGYFTCGKDSEGNEFLPWIILAYRIRIKTYERIRSTLEGGKIFPILHVPLNPKTLEESFPGKSLSVNGEEYKHLADVFISTDFKTDQRMQFGNLLVKNNEDSVDIFIRPLSSVLTKEEYYGKIFIQGDVPLPEIS